MNPVVIDTNCLLQIISRRSPYRPIWDAFLQGRYDLCVSNDTRVGEELKLERVDFCAALSSDSRNYATSFTGRMILKERSMDVVVIGMEDVHFSILHGEYVLNGDLVGICF